MNLIQAILTQKTQLSALAVGYALKIIEYVQISKLKLKTPSPCPRIPQLSSFSLATGQPALPPLLQKIHNDLWHQWETKILIISPFGFHPNHL